MVTGECGARAYNGVWGRSPRPAGFRGRTPGGSQGAKSPEDESLLPIFI